MKLNAERRLPDGSYDLTGRDMSEVLNEFYENNSGPLATLASMKVLTLQEAIALADSVSEKIEAAIVEDARQEARRHIPLFAWSDAPLFYEKPQPPTMHSYFDYLREDE